MKIHVDTLRRLIREAIESELDEEIEELRTYPEFKSIDAFVDSKLDDDVYEFNFVELQALARNMTQAKVGRRKITQASQRDVDSVRGELSGLGFKFVGRQPIKKVRGFTSSAHGTSPFAGSHGGSGFGSDGFTAHGGGPGAIGGGVGAKNDIPMGPRRR